MAIPGYHDPAYDPIVVTGEAMPLDEAWQEKIAKLLRQARDRMNKGGFTPGHPLNIWKKVMDDRVLGGQTGLMAPPDEPPPGIGTTVLPDPEAMSRWGKGDAPYTMGEPGLAGRLPMLKPGRAADAVNIATSIPLATGVQAPAFIGAIRRKGDLIAKPAAEKLAQYLLEDSHIRTLSDPYIGGGDATIPKYQALEKSLTKYFQTKAGLPGDPLENLPGIRREQVPYYDTTKDPLTPPKPYESPSSYDLEALRAERPDSTMPDTGTMAHSIDDIVSSMLMTGKKPMEAFKQMQEFADLDPALAARLQKLAEVMTGDAWLADQLSPENVAAKVQGPARKIEEATGMRPENIPATLERMPQGAYIGAFTPNGGQSWWGDAGSRFQELLKSERFGDFVAGKSAADLEKMPLETVLKEFVQNEKNSLREWAKTAKGRMVAPAASDAYRGYAWQELEAIDKDTPAPSLVMEGKRQGHCIGDPGQGYCRKIVEGKGRAFSLRDGDNKPRVTLFLDKVHTPDGYVWELQQAKGPHNKYLDQLPAEHAAEVENFLQSQGFLATRNELTDVQRFKRALQGQQGAAEKRYISKKDADFVDELYSPKFTLEKQFGKDVLLDKQGNMGYLAEKDLETGRKSVGHVNAAEIGDSGEYRIEGFSREAVDPGTVSTYMQKEIARRLGGATTPGPEYEAFQRMNAEKQLLRDKMKERGVVAYQPGFPEEWSEDRFRRALEIEARDWEQDGNYYREPYVRVFDYAMPNRADDGLGAQITRIARRGGELWSVSAIRPPRMAPEARYRGLYWLRELGPDDMTQGQREVIEEMLENARHNFEQGGNWIPE